MSEQADVILVGVGTGGEELGGRLAMAGLDVVGIEPALVGGECAFWACIPTKMMIRAANLLQEARRVDGVAGQATVTPDWAPVAQRVREQATGDWDDTQAVQRFEGRGGRFVRGRGTLTSPTTVAVGDQTFAARRGIVIATGSKPARPPISGLADVRHWTTHDAVAAKELPGSLLVLGGGAVGCELGQVFARFGVSVTIIEAADRLLPAEEPEVGAALGAVFAEEGITVHTGARAARVAEQGEAVRVELEHGTALTGDELLVAVGRVAATDGLGLEAADVQLADGFIAVDEQLRAADGIWAMGDVTGKGLFTHVALHHAPIVEAGILGQEPPPLADTDVPRATFTDPEVASVGLREADARAAGVDVAVTVKDTSATFRGFLHGPGNAGLIKLVADRATGVLVGGTAVGPHGGEVLGLLSAAVHGRLTLADLRRMVYAFPTFHGGVGEAIGAYAQALVQVLDPETEPLREP